MLRFKLHHLFAYSLFITALCVRPAQAMGVSFGLTESPSQPSSRPKTDAPTAALPQASSKSFFKPLPIPPAASQPPVQTTQTAKSLPDNAIASTRVLPAPTSAAMPVSRILPPLKQPAPKQSRDNRRASLGLSFSPPQVTLKVQPPSASVPKTTHIPDWIYQGDADSLVARTVGSAEGTRTASGHATRAYYGHVDPGNGVWNMGTFSYQHGAKTPKEADKKQLKRLKRQGKALAHQANQAELSMTLGEILNGLDLANQAPLAALDEGGYIDRLAQARQKGMRDGDAIVWARTYAYIDPRTQRWNAPGLGNTLNSITRDQQRRYDAVSRAFDDYHATRLSRQSQMVVSLDASPKDQVSMMSPALAQVSTNTAVVTHPPSTTPATVAAEITPVKFDIAQAITVETTAAATVTTTLPGATSAVSLKKQPVDHTPTISAATEPTSKTSATIETEQVPAVSAAIPSPHSMPPNS